MKIKIIFVFLLLMISGFANAKTVYVTDNMSVDIKTDDDNASPVLTTVTSGTPLTLLSSKRKFNYAEVRLANGQTGFILNSYLSPQPASKWYLEQANLELEKLKEEHSKTKLELATIKKRGANAITEALTQERDKLAEELKQLRIISANAVAIEKQRNSLQEDYIKATSEFGKVKDEFEQLKLEKKASEARAEQRWFIYGGLLSLFGVLLGYILPKLSWRRKGHNWDTF